MRYGLWEAVGDDPENMIMLILDHLGIDTRDNPATPAPSARLTANSRSKSVLLRAVERTHGRGNRAVSLVLLRQFWKTQAYAAYALSSRFRP